MDLTEALPRLVEASTQGKLDWDNFGNNAFIAPVGTVFVSIKISNGIFMLTLHDEGGTTLETKSIISGNGPDYTAARELHELARRRALNIDGALLELKKGLDAL